MATKTKTKAKTKTTRKAKPKGSVYAVPNHRFAAGATVGVFNASDVGFERSIGREPIPKPLKTAKVHKNGVLEFRGLGKGRYLAASETDGRFLYVEFSIK